MRKKMLELIRKVADFRPHGLFGQVEDDVAGLRQEAVALLKQIDNRQKVLESCANEDAICNREGCGPTCLARTDP